MSRKSNLATICKTQRQKANTKPKNDRYLSNGGTQLSEQRGLLNSHTLLKWQLMDI